MTPPSRTESIVHVIGAGLAGLSAAVRLAQAGRRVALHEAAGHAGGRCRSFVDAAMGTTIDNGNHLLLSGNQAAHAYLRAIGAENSLAGPGIAEYPFLDLASGERWSLRPGRSRIPWWIFRADRRPPGTRASDFLAGLRLGLASEAATVADCVDTRGPLFRKFWEPLTVAVLNAAPGEGAAALLWPVLRETFARGEAACRPRIAAHGLSDSFVTPALDTLRKHGAAITFNDRLRRIVFSDNRVSGLELDSGSVSVGADATVILAVPPAGAASLLPNVAVPEDSRAIVNAHFRLDRRHDGVTILGLVGGMAQWLFWRGDVASVTISAADALVDSNPDHLAEQLWREIATALGVESTPLPPHRIVKEKRATFAQVPSALAKRAPTRSPWANLLLAGDWTATGLPATIEGAICSGHSAAEAVLAGAAKA